MIFQGGKEKEKEMEVDANEGEIKSFQQPVHLTSHLPIHISQTSTVLRNRFGPGSRSEMP